MTTHPHQGEKNMHKIPDAPDFTQLRDTFREAVVKGKDGRPEYVAWRDDWNAYIAKVAEAKAAEQRDHDAKERQFAHLFQEARRLNALAHRVGGRIDSADRGSFYYSPERHQQAEAQWRADLARYTGNPVPEDTAVSVDEVPFVPHLSLAYFTLDTSNAPSDYSDELNAALNAAVGIA